MCKGQQMRWSRLGARCVVQVRAALLNQELGKPYLDFKREPPVTGDDNVSHRLLRENRDESTTPSPVRSSVSRFLSPLRAQFGARLRWSRDLSRASR